MPFFLCNYVNRRGRISVFVFMTILLFSQCSESRLATADNDSFDYLRKQFQAPDKQYGSAPLWVWNDAVTKEEIKLALADFKEKAFGGVFIHPRPGLITPYLSKEWNELFTYAVQEGRTLGLEVWIYDENSYPSGFAGGHVPQLMPESYNQGQMLHLVKTATLPDTAGKFFICLKKENNGYVDITNKLDQYKGTSGDYCLFEKAFYGKSDWYGGFSYVDLMVKGVTEKFIEVTMKEYEKSFGNEFGKTVPGIFSDEPNIEVQGRGNIRWTPDLFTTFKNKWGYDLTPHLVSLFDETGDWKKVRHNYYQVLLQLFIDRWSKPFYQYTQQKKLEWTGHYWEHAWPSPNHGPDNMAMYAWHQRPGIDMLFNQFNEVNPHAQFGNIRAVKELGSVANQLNKKRALSETYGGGGWDLTFKDMKRLGDWEYVLGVNSLNQHLAFMTISGARKYDYPQSFSYHNPWWPYYASLNLHFARLSLALSRGGQHNHILVLEPTTSAWMYTGIPKSNERFTQIAQQFQAFVTTLEKAQVEYDLGSENIIKDSGRVANGKFVIDQRAYSTVIIPPGMENVDQPTFKLLQEYAAAGGKIIQFSPLTTLDGASNNLLSTFNDLRGNKIAAKELSPQVINEHLQSADFKITGIGTDSIGGDLYHHRRELKNGQILFLANASMTSSAKGSIQMKGKTVLLLETLSGDVFNYPVKQNNNQQLVFDFEIPAAGSRLFFIGNGEVGNYPTYAAGGKETPLTTSVLQVIRPAENTLMIDFCDVKIGNTLLTDKHVYNAADTVFKHHGFKNGNPWNTSVQFGSSTLDRNRFTAGSGFTTIYHFTIADGVDASAFKAVVERPSLYKISINGNSVQPVPGKWWLEKQFGVLEIGKYLQKGDNVLQLVADPMDVLAEVEPVYILGNFNLQSADKGWNIVAPAPLTAGSWKTQGLPMYGHAITYTKELSLDKVPASAVLRLGEWSGTIASVKVNGADAGIIGYDPYQLNITRYLKTGSNKIAISITGSLKNLLGPHHNAPKGLASPWNWRNVKKYPSGEAYDTYDYGLMGDFQVIAIEH